MCGIYFNHLVVFINVHTSFKGTTIIETIIATNDHLKTQYSIVAPTIIWVF